MVDRHTRPVRQTQAKPVSVARTINILDSKLRLLAQRIKVLENNLQIMARTVVSHNKKLKELEEMGGGPAFSKEEIIEEISKKLPKTGSVDLSEIKARLDRIEDQIADLRSDLDEVKYVVDSINPMELVTINQLKEAIDERLSQTKKG